MALFTLAHRRHTARPLHHGRTSYASLAFLLMMCGVVLSSYSVTAGAATVPTVENPQDGSIGLTGAVRGPAPNQAAVITSPSDGFRLTDSPITVSGTCPQNTYVSIYRNGVFSGVTACDGDGKFSLLVELLAGSNQLQAKVSDALGQSGPDSRVVTVVYAPTQAVSGGGTAGIDPLLIVADIGIYGVSPNQKLERKVTIIGGVGPYAISWDFGDGTTLAIPQATAGVGSASHTYNRAGTYRVIVRVTDSTGNTALIQLITVVNGATNTTIATAKNRTDTPGLLFGLWPLYIMAILMVLAFWWGERRELRKLRRRNQVMPGV